MASTKEVVFEQQFEKALLTHWIQPFLETLKINNLRLMQNIKEREVTDVLRSYLRKVYELKGQKQFWMRLREISDLVTVVQSITGLSYTELQVNIQAEMHCIFEDVGLNYDFCKTQVLRILNLNSMLQLGTIDKKHFELFLTKLNGPLNTQATRAGRMFDMEVMNQIFNKNEINAIVSVCMKIMYHKIGH